MQDTPGGGPTSEQLFIHLVMMFHVAAMQQLGKVMNPITNKIERELEQAKFSIDTISMLKEKTKGNLSPSEEEYLGKVLFELQMNYVDEVDRAKREEKESKEKAAEEKVTGETEAAPERKEAEDKPTDKVSSSPKASAKKRKGVKNSSKGKKKA